MATPTVTTRAKPFMTQIDTNETDIATNVTALAQRQSRESFTTAASATVTFTFLAAQDGLPVVLSMDATDGTATRFESHSWDGFGVLTATLDGNATSGGVGCNAHVLPVS